MPEAKDFLKDADRQDGVLTITETTFSDKNAFEDPTAAGEPVNEVYITNEGKSLRRETLESANVYIANTLRAGEQDAFDQIKKLSAIPEKIVKEFGSYDEFIKAVGNRDMNRIGNDPQDNPGIYEGGLARFVAEARAMKDPEPGQGGTERTNMPDINVSERTPHKDMFGSSPRGGNWRRVGKHVAPLVIAGVLARGVIGGNTAMISGIEDHEKPKTVTSQSIQDERPTVEKQSSSEANPEIDQSQIQIAGELRDLAEKLKENPTKFIDVQGNDKTDIVVVQSQYSLDGQPPQNIKSPEYTQYKFEVGFDGTNKDPKNVSAIKITVANYNAGSDTPKYLYSFGSSKKNNDWGFVYDFDGSPEKGNDKWKFAFATDAGSQPEAAGKKYPEYATAAHTIIADAGKANYLPTTG
jgi:hypothetical protein